MKKWQDFFNTEISKEFKDRVMAQASVELTALKVPVAPPWFLRWQFASSMAGILAVFIYFKNQTTTMHQQQIDFLATSDQDLLEDLDLFEDFELIESLNEETGEFES